MRRGPATTCMCGGCPKCKRRVYMREWSERTGREYRPPPAKAAARANSIYHARKSRDPQFVLAHRAHGRVYKALKKGTLVKGPCEVGVGCRGRIEAHHDDYDKPLEVRWLCARHHSFVDQQEEVAA